MGRKESQIQDRSRPSSEERWKDCPLLEPELTWQCIMFSDACVEMSSGENTLESLSDHGQMFRQTRELTARLIRQHGHGIWIDLRRAPAPKESARIAQCSFTGGT